MQTPAKKLLDQVRDTIRVKHYSYRTEETYMQWIRRYEHAKQKTVPMCFKRGHRESNPAHGVCI